MDKNIKRFMTDETDYDYLLGKTLFNSSGVSLGKIIAVTYHDGIQVLEVKERGYGRYFQVSRLNPCEKGYIFGL